MQKVAVVTGSNKGIGLSTVKILCKKFDGVVYLTARSVENGEEAIKKLKEEGLDPKFHQLDIDDTKSIETFCNYLKNTYGGLDVLVNNAAIAYMNASIVPFPQQAEHTLRINYFRTQEVCHALFPLLRPHARVVNVSSSMGKLCQINGKEPQATELRKQLAAPDLTEDKLDQLINQFLTGTKDGSHTAEGWPSNSYSVSKVGLAALSFIQQRQFDSDPRPDLVVNAVHPGYIKTSMTGGSGLGTPDEGAEPLVFLALLPSDNPGHKGAFIYRDSKPRDWAHS